MNPDHAMRELCAGWERGDADAIALLFAADGRYEGPLFEEVPVGPDAVRAACAAAFAELAEVRVPIRHLAVAGDVAMAEGQFLSADRDGARTDFELVMVVELRDGKIARFTEYFDTAQLG